VTKPHWLQIAKLRSEGTQVLYDEEALAEITTPSLPAPMFTLEELTETTDAPA
jgi:hypothetical protein